MTSSVNKDGFKNEKHVLLLLVLPVPQTESFWCSFCDIKNTGEMRWGGGLGKEHLKKVSLCGQVTKSTLMNGTFIHKFLTEHHVLF